MAMPCKSSLPEDSHPSVTGIGRSPEDREIRMTTPVSSTNQKLSQYVYPTKPSKDSLLLAHSYSLQLDAISGQQTCR